MAASPQLVTSAPLFLNANTLVYTAADLRKPYDDLGMGAGVLDSDSFRIRQRAAGGANMSIDAMTASVNNKAWVRATGDAGLYQVAYNSSTVVNVDIATADATNPRIDAVYLAVEDGQIVGGNNRATIRVVTGTPTGGATLDNRTGIGATPSGMSYILLATILVPASSSTVTNANIRDERHFAVKGGQPAPFTASLDCVMFEPVGESSNNASIQSTAGFDAQQAAALMWLPKRVKGATKIRLRVQQGATANLANSVIAVFSASGRLICNTTAAAFGGSASQVVESALTIAQGATDFEPGYYWVFQGNATGTSGGSVTAIGVGPYVAGFGATCATAPNQYVYATSGGTTIPTTILAMTDLSTITAAAQVLRPAVPVIGLANA